MTDTTTHTTTFDATALRRGVEQRDAPTLKGLSQPDASIEISDAAHGPSTPLRFEGEAAIAGYLDDVFGRDMQHRVEILSTGADAIGYTLRCAYPDGTLVRCCSVAELRDGRIVREIV